MKREEVKEWLDKLVEAKKIMNENVFFDKEELYKKPNICNSEEIQMASGGWIERIAKLLGLECSTEPIVCETFTSTQYSFVYGGITFISLEGTIDYAD